MSDVNNIKKDFIAKLDNNLNLEEIHQIKTELFGKNGLISSQFKNIGSIAETERKIFASDLNKIKDELQNLITNKINEVDTNKINKKLEKEKIDITLPERPFVRGKIHPVSQTIDEISSIFSEIGFSVEEGPDVENEYNNFTALNTPDNHPARDMHDTFYLDEKKELLLRTHTSPVQIRTMLNDKPPFKIIAPGRTYRSDSDQTHAPMFHQVEGLHIDKDINIRDYLSEIISSFKEISKKEFVFNFDQDSNPKKIGKSIEIVYGLRNFIGNANKFAKNSIFINLKSDSEFTELTIEDDGNGYPRDIISKIGEPYLKSNYSNDRSKQGLGLGLFIGKTLLEKNFATINCRNSKTRSGAEVIVKWRNRELFNI